MRRSSGTVLSLLLLTLVGCAGIRPAWFPGRSCAEAWKGLPAAQATYNWDRDSKRGGDGNLGYAGYAARVERRACYKPWTLLVYMAADNDLNPYAYLNLYEMEAGPAAGDARRYGSTEKVDLVVQLDDALERGRRRLHMFQTPDGYAPEQAQATLAHPGPQGLRSPVVEVLGENSVDEAGDLEAFLRWGVRAYPAEHYLAVVWGHGEGWAPAGTGAGAATGAVFGGLALDEHPATRIDTPGLHRALQGVADGELHRPLDIYASDACLMQSVEVAAEIDGAARYIIGSTQVENFYGLPYRELLGAMNGDGTAARAGAGPSAIDDTTRDDQDEARRVARLLVRTFQRAWDTHGARAELAPLAAETFTLSAIDSAALKKQLLPALATLGQALDGYLAEDPLHAIDLRAVLKAQTDMPRFLGGLAELGGFVDATRQAVGHGPGLQQALGGALDLTEAALSATVLDYAYGSTYRDGRGQPRFPGFRGVSVWLPSTAGELKHREAAFSGAPLWRGGPGPVGPWGAWQERLARLSPDP